MRIKSLLIVLLFALLLAAGCGRTESAETTKEKETTAGAASESSSESAPSQSAATEGTVPGKPLVTGDITEDNLEQVCNILKEAGLSHVDTFAEWVRNTASGADADSDVSGFQDASCRLTVMLLAGELIHSDSVEEDYQGTYLMFDLEAIENQEAFALLKGKEALFTTLFGETEIPEGGFEQLWAEKWEKHGISVKSEKCAIISLVFKAYEQEAAFVGHTGILVDCRDRADVSTDYIFVEKIAFGDPFRVSLINDEAELMAMLSERSDYSVEEGDPSPAVYKNGSLIGKLNVTGTAEAITPTGYPDGEIQRQTLYYKGTLYQYNGTLIVQGISSEHPVLLGKVINENNLILPKDDFHSSRIEVGKEVYSFGDMDILWVKEAENRYIGLEPVVEP